MGTESKLPISSSHNISTHAPVTNREQIIELSSRDASWSVDGKQMVFARGSAVYLANGFGSVARQVYSGMGLVSAPQFSSDGEWIRFTVRNPERHATSLWEVSRDGSDAHALH